MSYTYTEVELNSRRRVCARQLLGYCSLESALWSLPYGGRELYKSSDRQLLGLCCSIDQIFTANAILVYE